MSAYNTNLATRLARGHWACSDDDDVANSRFLDGDGSNIKAIERDREMHKTHGYDDNESYHFSIRLRTVALTRSLNKE